VKVSSQLLENRQAALTIEVDDERVQQALHQTAKRVSNQVDIPGFRKGKAPYNVVVRAVGENRLYDEMLDTLGEQIYREALEESQLDPYGPGQLDDVKLKPLVLHFTVPLRPTVELGDYRALRVPFTAPQIKDEAVEQVLASLQERNAIVEPAGEGPAELNQIAVLTMEGKLSPDENAETIIHEHDVNLLVADTTEFPFPGFVQHLIGMKVGEEKSFEITVPESAGDAELTGKTVYFQVKLEGLKVRRVPPLDDALAQTVGEYETLDALRAAVRDSLLQQATQEANSKYGEECLQKLVEQTHIEFPPNMVEDELDELIKRTEQRLKDQKMNLDEFLNIKKQSRDEYRNELRPRAENNVRRALVLGTLAEVEGLKVSADEVTEQINSLAGRYGNQAELQAALSSSEGKRSLGLNLLTDKVYVRLVSICKGENPPLPTAEEPAQPIEVSAAEAVPIPAGEELTQETK
jgi:trigger factor